MPFLLSPEPRLEAILHWIALIPLHHLGLQGFNTGSTTSCFGGLPGVLEKEIEGLFGLDMGGDTTQGTIFFKSQTHGGERLALLFGNALDFLIDLVAGGGDGLTLGDPGKQE